MPGMVAERRVARGNPRLHAAVIESGLTYEELASQLNVSAKTVDRWINEPGRRPYARHAQAVARVLGVDVWDLWPSTARTEPETVSVPAQFTHAAREALAQVERLNLGEANATEMAMHLGALSASVRSLLDFIEPAEVSA